MVRFFRAIRPADSATSRPSLKVSSKVRARDLGQGSRSNGVNRFRFGAAVCARWASCTPPNHRVRRASAVGGSSLSRGRRCCRRRGVGRSRRLWPRACRGQGRRVACGHAASGCPAPGCGIVLADGLTCDAPVADGAGLNLCATHLLAAHDQVAGDVGVTDLLPSPCLACGCRVGVRLPVGLDLRRVRVAGRRRARRRPRAGRVEVVYYVRYRDQVKIGTSSNPRLRLASIPHDEVLAFERGGRAARAATACAVRRSPLRGHRVVRACTTTLLEHVAELTAGIDDPWARYHFWVSRQLALHG